MTKQHEWGVSITPQDPWPMERPGEMSYHDYAGVAQLDTDITSFAPSLYEIVGLDRERWSIVGINASPHSGRPLVEGDERDDLIRVYAVDQAQLTEEQKRSGGLVDGKDGPVNVVEFHCHDLTLDELFKAFKTVRLSFVRRHIDPRRIKVTGCADIPIQNG